MKQDIRIAAQKAMLGEVPSSLRFVYASETAEGAVRVTAVLDSSATEDHLDCVHCFCAEIIAGYPFSTPYEEYIEISDARPWKIGDGSDLVFLRYGETNKDSNQPPQSTPGLAPRRG